MVILRLDVGHMQEAVASHGKVDKRRLDRRLKIDDLSLVNVACITLETRSFDVKLLENAVFDDGDPALLRLEHVDEHLFLHAGVFLTRSVGVVGLTGLRSIPA
jgi:hypothetical protein